MESNRKARRPHRPLLAALAALLVLPATALGGERYAPPGKGIYTGVSDTGSKQDYFDFTEAVGTHVAVLQGFELWGRWPEETRQRWNRTETRGMLSISTAPCYECEEVISPRSIRRGGGDGYLLRMNAHLAEWDRPTYIRLLPEMNGHWNPYAAFNEDGSRRGSSHSTAQFRKAWRRSVLIIRGGATKRINRRLRRSGMPPIRSSSRVPRRIPRTKTSFLWVPQTAGSPNLRANRPQAYWPGARYVDWVGADIYGKFPNFAGLNDFYRDFRRKPFLIGEWSPWDVDDPAFVRRLHRWVESHRRAKMMVYYQGFGPGNPFEIQHYPASERALRRQLRDPRYLARAPDTRRPDRGRTG